jgi:hypothetical protein
MLPDPLKTQGSSGGGEVRCLVFWYGDGSRDVFGLVSAAFQWKTLTRHCDMD